MRSILSKIAECRQEFGDTRIIIEGVAGLCLGMAGGFGVFLLANALAGAGLSPFGSSLQAVSPAPPLPSLSQEGADRG